MGEVAARVRALREALELTQEELGKRCGHEENGRVYLSKIETGKNKLGSVQARADLAKGFGISRDDLDDYLAGALPLQEMTRRAQRGVTHPELVDPPRRDTPPPPAPEGTDDYEDALEASLLWSLDRERHTMRDIDAVRAVLRNTPRMRDPDADLIASARIWLDAAARLRKQGKPVTIESLLMAVTVGLKNAQVSASSQALQESTEQEWKDRLTAHKEKT